MECSLLGWANLIVLTVTGAVIAWYTVETSKLRREAQLQTELQTRPFLSLECHAGGQAYVGIVNIGKGLARSITIPDIVIDGSMEIRSNLITHIAAGDETQGAWRVWVRPLPEHAIGEMPGNDHHRVASSAIASNDVTVTMRYASIVGQRYETTVRIRTGIAEITGDRRLSG